MIRRFFAFVLGLALAISPINAALTVNQLSGFNAKQAATVVGPRTLTYRTASTSASATSLTLASVSIGTASSDRLVAVAVAFSDASVAVSSVTVGGTEIVSNVASASTFEARARIFYGLITSGTTADVVVTMTGSTIIHAAVYTILLNGASQIPSATSTDTSLSAGVLSTNVTVPTDGVYIAATSQDSGGITWTTATERSEAALSSAGSRGGSASGTSAGGSVTVTTTGGSSPGALILATW